MAIPPRTRPTDIPDNPRMNASMKRFITLLFPIAMLLSQSAVAQSVAPAQIDEAPISASKGIKDCALCPEIVGIPAGTFLRGSVDRNASEQPVHEVSVKGFMIGRTEVTQGEWTAVMGTTPSANSQCGESCPVESVSWNDVQAYLNKLRELTDKQYRLPSEAEWEYAARAGTTTAYAWGATASHEHANYGSEECCGGLADGRDKWEHSSPVGQFPPNAFGLYDMHGNVAEWVEDVYHKNYFLAPGDGSAWITGNPAERLARVVRGGAWNLDAASVRVTSRGKAITVEPSDGIGFRVARPR